MTGPQLAAGFDRAQIQLLQLQSLPEAARFRADFDRIRGVFSRWIPNAADLRDQMLVNGEAVLNKAKSDLDKIELLLTRPSVTPSGVSSGGTLVRDPDGGIQFVSNDSPNADFGGLGWTASLPFLALAALAVYALTVKKSGSKGSKRKTKRRR